MLLCISGSLRKASASRKLLTKTARLFGGPSELADLRMPLYDPAPARALRGAIAGADAVAIASPEYNHFPSGVLKNAIDQVSRMKESPWEDKPVAIMSAPSGRSGGARGASALRLALARLGPRLSSGPEVLLTNAGVQFEENGKLKDPTAEALPIQAMEKLRSERGPHPWRSTSASRSSISKSVSDEPVGTSGATSSSLIAAAFTRFTILTSRKTTNEMMLLYSSRQRSRGDGRAEVAMDLPHDVSLDASHDFSPRFSFRGSPGGIGLRLFVIPHVYDGHAIDRSVGLSVASAVQVPASCR